MSASEMKLRSRVLDIPQNMVVLHVSGRINTSQMLPLERELEKLSNGPTVKLILDVHEVDGIDSQGVGILIKAQQTITARGGKVVLMAAQDRILTVLKIAGLDQYFQFAKTEFQAIKLFEENPQ